MGPWPGLPWPRQSLACGGPRPTAHVQVKPGLGEPWWGEGTGGQELGSRLGAERRRRRTGGGPETVGLHLPLPPPIFSICLAPAMVGGGVRSEGTPCWGAGEPPRERAGRVFCSKCSHVKSWKRSWRRRRRRRTGRVPPAQHGGEWAGGGRRALWAGGQPWLKKCWGVSLGLCLPWEPPFQAAGWTWGPCMGGGGEELLLAKAGTGWSPALAPGTQQLPLANGLPGGASHTRSCCSVRGAVCGSAEQASLRMPLPGVPLCRAPPPPGSEAAHAKASL